MLLQDPPKEQGAYDIRVVAACTKRGGYSTSATEVITGVVGDAITAGSIEMLDVAKGQEDAEAAALATALDTKLSKADQELSKKIEKLAALVKMRGHK
eukprot:SAG31_NODE_11129_length_1063_cov_1.096473_2_plen_98_part_00